MLMSDHSGSRKIILILVLLCSTVTCVGANMFEREVVPISRINDEPTVYDSTIAYRTITVTGNISDIDRHTATIVEDSHSLKVDIRRMELFEGFSVNDGILVTGQFRYERTGESLFIPTYVLHYPIEDMGMVNISNILDDPASHNGRYLTVIGNLSNLEMSMGRYTATVADEENNALKVFYYGSTDLAKGDEIKVAGLYNGNLLHSESMSMNRSPLSISNLVPGFSSFMGLLAIFAMALLLKKIKFNE